MGELSLYLTSNGHRIRYAGKPDFALLDKLAEGEGHLWHSSLDQGFKNLFQELSYQTYTVWWYINDFDGLDKCPSWRVNTAAFAIREEVWLLLKGFDTTFSTNVMQGLSLGFDLLRAGGVPLYIKDLFPAESKLERKIPIMEQYIFYRKKFRSVHLLYMVLRRGFLNPVQWFSFFYALIYIKRENAINHIPPKSLEEIRGNPTVSYIIPTMLRQEYTSQLLNDLNSQTYPPTQVVVVDATPEEARNINFKARNYTFELIYKYQTSKGSCRARNEAIELCTGDYIIFGDDDIRLATDFIEKHVRFLQTYKVGACNGLDLRADHHQQGLEHLQEKREMMGIPAKCGLTTSFNNANSCVKRDLVNQLVGNDINFDGGYGEDADFGLSLIKMGVAVMFNPFAASLHLKPPAGGYRWWGNQARILGKKRKKQPWELDRSVRWIRPVPSPTIMYLVYKHYKPRQQREYRFRYLSNYVVSGSLWRLPLRVLNLPHKVLQFNESISYAKGLIKLGVRHR